MWEWRNKGCQETNKKCTTICQNRFRASACHSRSSSRPFRRKRARCENSIWPRRPSQALYIFLELLLLCQIYLYSTWWPFSSIAPWYLWEQIPWGRSSPRQNCFFGQKYFARKRRNSRTLPWARLVICRTCAWLKINASSDGFYQPEGQCCFRYRNRANSTRRTSPPPSGGRDQRRSQIRVIAN